MAIGNQKLSELQVLLDPVMEYLRDNFHPHVSISIDSERSEILEGQAMLLRTTPSCPGRPAINPPADPVIPAPVKRLCWAVYK